MSVQTRSCLAVQANGESNKPQPRQLLSIRDCLFASVKQPLKIINILINKAKAHLAVSAAIS